MREATPEVGSPGEPERIRRVRYAADCAEHVLHLTGTSRPHAEATIAAARAWADRPCEETRQVAMSESCPTCTTDELASHAIGAATLAAAEAAGDFVLDDARVCRAAGGGAFAAWFAGVREGNGNFAIRAERQWQAARRRHYCLPETGEEP